MAKASARQKLAQLDGVSSATPFEFWNAVDTAFAAAGAAMRIWVVTDGRAGNENPALGLAEAVSERLGGARPVIEVKRVTPRRPYDLAPPALWSALGAREGGWPFCALADRGAALARRPDAPWPGLAIGAGRRAAPLVAALRQLDRKAGGAMRAVQILSPQLPLRHFDLVITPRHDRLTGANVLQTTGSLHRLTPAMLAARDPRLDALPKPLLAVLIGGPSRSARFEQADVGALLAALREAAGLGWGIAATTSRRTPPADFACVREAVHALGGWLWDGAGGNPLHAMLGGADAIVVTADSVNMASEACSVGAPAFVAPVSWLAPKLARFHQALIAEGHARPLSELMRSQDWRPVRLDDMGHAAAAVCALCSARPKNVVR